MMTKPKIAKPRAKQSKEGSAMGLPSTRAAEVDPRAGELELNTNHLGDPRVTILHTVSCPLPGVSSIHPGDILVADRSLPPADGDLVIVSIGGESAVRLFSSEGKTVGSNPSRKKKKAAVRDKGPDVRILASVTSVIPVGPD